MTITTEKALLAGMLLLATVGMVAFLNVSDGEGHAHSHRSTGDLIRERMMSESDESAEYRSGLPR